MLTIDDIAKIESWTGTRSYREAGSAILEIAQANKKGSEFDAEYITDDTEKHIIDGKYIISGVKHDSKAERDLMELVFREIKPYQIPDFFWSDADFIRTDREQIKIKLSEIIENHLDLVKNFHFGYLTNLRGVKIGFTPEMHYNCPDPEYLKDDKGVEIILSHAPAGRYTVIHIMDDDDYNHQSIQELWIKPGEWDLLFDALDASRGKQITK